MTYYSKLFLLSVTILVFQNCQQKTEHRAQVKKEIEIIEVHPDSLFKEIDITQFAGPNITPSPACLGVSPSGDVFVGVDMMGSLGKKPNKGSIIKLTDKNNDGIADTHTVFAKVDNPRGIISLGNQLFVLHTTFSQKTQLASGMDLVVFEDNDEDGIADGPSKPIIENICAPTYIVKRGTDHATNGIRMGIDGWIYIAVGDFGFHNAVDRSGKKMTMLGGGIVRVRPDGTEMEIYTHGLRNIYDMAIDPFMNIYTRGNTNDGGGWNIRFAHHIQSGEYGYPVLFKHFTNEIIPALVDVGGGSGTGSLYMDDENWPDKFNKVPMMADWGRSQLYMHRLNVDGASYTQKEVPFLKLAQITDLDIDASGRLYMSAWDGAGYSGNPDKGFVVRATPKNWKYEKFPNLKELSIDELSTLLKSNSASKRLNAQQELINRPTKKAASAAWRIASDSKLSLDIRVAGIFTYAQIEGENGIQNLVNLCNDKDVTEFALKALSDRKTKLKSVPLTPFIEGLKDASVRVQTAAIIGLGRMGNLTAAKYLLQIKVPESAVAPAKGIEGLHATPNSAIIPAHLTVRALVSMNAIDACVEAVKADESKIGLWALKYMHSERTVDGLIATYNTSKNNTFKKEILTTISRLYHKEAPYDGSWWWSTRPDTHGPYYKGITWNSSSKIKAFLMQEWKNASAEEKLYFGDLNSKHRMGIEAFGGEEELIEKKEVIIDLDKIKNKKGQVGKSSIEDVMLAIEKIKGNSKSGKKLFTQQGCVACHSVKKGEALKGPYMGQIGSIMTRDQIAESILKPNASISQGFSTASVKTKGGKTFTGFVTSENSGKLVMRDFSGNEFTVQINEIISRQEVDASMMPSGLANSLSFEEFASLITYLSEQKK